MARTASTPTTRLESVFRKMQAEFSAVETLVQKGRLDRAELLSSAQEMFVYAVEQYTTGHAPFRAHAAEWAGNVAALAWLSDNPVIEPQNEGTEVNALTPQARDTK